MPTINLDDINPDDDDEQRRANELARDYILNSPGYASIQESIRQITAALQPQLGSMLQNSQIQALYRDALPRFDLSSYLKVANVNYGQLAIKRALDMVRPDLFQIPDLNPFIANAGAWRDMVAEQQGAIIRDLAAINTPVERLAAMQSLIDDLDIDEEAIGQEIDSLVDTEAMVTEAEPQLKSVGWLQDLKTRREIVRFTKVAVWFMMIGLIFANPVIISTAVTLFSLTGYNPKTIAELGGDMAQAALDKLVPLKDGDDDKEEDTPSQ